MKIICVGRNYRAHAAELKNEVSKEPVLFLKPQTAIPIKGQPFFYPDFSKEIHYEAEVVVKIKKLGKHIAPEFAHKYYDELSLGIDFTARDLQSECKEKGLPWEKAKAFDGSAALGSFISKEKFKDMNNIDFQLFLNGEKKQDGNSKDMLFSIDELIAYISTFFTLKIGDVIYTGTPEGVGEVKKGDQLEGVLGGEKVLKIAIR